MDPHTYDLLRRMEALGERVKKLESPAPVPHVAPAGTDSGLHNGKREECAVCGRLTGGCCTVRATPPEEET